MPSSRAPPPHDLSNLVCLLPCHAPPCACSKVYWGGGSVFLATSTLDWKHFRPSGPERFEDGGTRLTAMLCMLCMLNQSINCCVSPRQTCRHRWKAGCAWQQRAAGGRAAPSSLPSVRLIAPCLPCARPSHTSSRRARAPSALRHPQLSEHHVAAARVGGGACGGGGRRGLHLSTGSKACCCCCRRFQQEGGASCP